MACALRRTRPEVGVLVDEGLDNLGGRHAFGHRGDPYVDSFWNRRVWGPRWPELPPALLAAVHDFYRRELSIPGRDPDCLMTASPLSTGLTYARSVGDVPGNVGSVWRHPRRLGGSARRIALRARWALEDHRLIAEQRRGLLGRAHTNWRGNSVGENRLRWDDWDWSRGGEEWNASPEWKRALIDDVLARWIPRGGVVVEIGPGAGRWSQPLLERASRLILVDVSATALGLCRERFRDAENVEFVLSPGSEIPGIADAAVDAVWSFDVFVHLAPVDQANYQTEIARVLAPGGVAVIHHADGRNRGLLPSRHGWRSPMSRGLFASLATERGLLVECQFDSWGIDGRYDLSAYGDVITVCTRGSACGGTDQTANTR